MNDIISHLGIVDSISSGVVHVRITQSSACSSCKIASACSSAESKEKIIDVECINTDVFSIGQEVEVIAAAGVGFKAVLVAFIIPAIIIFAMVAWMINIGYSETMAALAGIGVVAIYYIGVHLLDKRLSKELTFTVKPLKKNGNTAERLTKSWREPDVI